MKIQTNVIEGQSKGCYLTVQVRYTRFLFKRWGKVEASHHAPQGWHLLLFAPKHCPQRGYRCVKFGIKNFNKPSKRMDAARARLGQL